MNYDKYLQLKDKTFRFNGTNKMIETHCFSSVAPYEQISTFSIDDDGTVNIVVAMPNITPIEKTYFLSKSFDFYSVPSGNPAIKGFAIRGAVSFDGILDPYALGKELIKKIGNSNITTCFLLDTASGTIEGIRMLFPKKELFDYLRESTLSMLEQEIDITTISNTFNNLLLANTPKQIIKRASLICKSKEQNIITNVMDFGGLNLNKVEKSTEAQ